MIIQIHIFQGWGLTHDHIEMLKDVHAAVTPMSDVIIHLWEELS